jgi:hypothetical protein
LKTAPYVPVTPATTLHVYVEIFEATLGPEVVEQEVTPVTPVTFQTPVPNGALAPFGPDTVAVNESVVPSPLVAAFAPTETVGKVLLTVVV